MFSRFLNQITFNLHYHSQLIPITKRVEKEQKEKGKVEAPATSLEWKHEQKIEVPERSIEQ